MNKPELLVPKKILVNLLDKICVFDKNEYLINNECYEKGMNENIINNFLYEIRDYYYHNEKKTMNYNNFICNSIIIDYTSAS